VGDYNSDEWYRRAHPPGCTCEKCARARLLDSVPPDELAEHFRRQKEQEGKRHQREDRRQQRYVFIAALVIVLVLLAVILTGILTTR